MYDPTGGGALGDDGLIREVELDIYLEDGVKDQLL